MIRDKAACVFPLELGPVKIARRDFGKRGPFFSKLVLDEFSMLPSKGRTVNCDGCFLNRIMFLTDEPNLAEIILIQNKRAHFYHAAFSMSHNAHAKGRGFDLVKIIGKIDREFHLPKYNYCGPNTRLQERLERGDKPINGLDRACLDHDKIYDTYQDLKNRHEADKILQKRAWERAKSLDANLQERLYALGVAGAMRIKRKIGAGVKTKTGRQKTKKIPPKIVKFEKLISVAKGAIPKKSSFRDGIKKAILATKIFIKKNLSAKNVPKPRRIIPIPTKRGGFLPAALIPIIAALGGVGGLAGGVSSVVNTINNIKTAQKQLEEQKRHNLQVEGKMVGSGLYLRPHKKGFGLYFNPYDPCKKN